MRGLILDEDFNQPVAGATITIEGRGALQSDGDGRFTLPDLSPGVYAVTVSRDGFETLRLTDLVVTPGSFTEVEGRLKADVLDIEDFVMAAEEVLGDDQVSVLDVRQATVSFANVIGSDFLSQIGASDAGKALQKTAGVSLVGDRYVVIRGLADRYNAITLNGAYVPSSDPDRRTVNIDLFPGSIVKRLSTYKTFVPSLPGEATGGAIDIETKGIPDKSFFKLSMGPQVNARATGNEKYLSYRGGGTSMLGTLDERRIPDIVRNSDLPVNQAIGDPELSSLRDRVNDSLNREMGTINKSAPLDFKLEATGGYRGTFWDRPAGLLFAVDYRKEYKLDDRGFSGRYSINSLGQVVLVDRQFEVTRSTENLRASFLAVAGIEPLDGHEIKLTLFTNLSAQDRATFQFGPVDNFNSFGLRESLSYTERHLRVLQLAGTHELDGGEGWKIKWQTSYGEATQDEPDQRFSENVVDENLSFFTIPANVVIPPFRRYWRELDDTKYNMNLDVEIPLFKDAEAERKTVFKGGGAFDYSTRDYRADSFAYTLGRNNTGGYPSLEKPFVAGTTWSDVFLYGNPLVSDVPPGIPATYLYRFTPEETYDADQKISAGYLMVESDIAKNLNMTFGARIEQTDVRIQGSPIYLLDPLEDGDAQRVLLGEENATPENLGDLNDPEQAAQNPVIVSRSKVNLNQLDVLPAVAFRFEMLDNMNLRTSYSRTVARPSFKELAPVVIRDAENSEKFVGNVDLQLSNIANYDMRWEWFPRPGMVFAVSGFAKDIQNAIERTSVGAIIQYQNVQRASVYGYEVEADSSLEFVTPELKDFSIGANYSYIISQVEREEANIFAGNKRRLQGQPDYLLNFNISYNNKEFGLFTGLYLNVTGAYLSAVGPGTGTPDIFVKPQTTLNFVLSKKFGKNFKLTFRANNLTSTRIEQFYNSPGSPVYDIATSSPTYSISGEYEW